jgi:hypothetical protein
MKNMQLGLSELGYVEDFRQTLQSPSSGLMILGGALECFIKLLDQTVRVGGKYAIG